MASSARVASSWTSAPPEMAVPMSWRMLPPSTSAQYSLDGTKRVTSAAWACAWAASSPSTSPSSDLRTGISPISANSVWYVSLGQHLEELERQALVLALRRDAQVRAAEERRGDPAVAARQGERAEHGVVLAGAAVLAGDLAHLPARAHQHADLAVAEVEEVLGIVGVGRRLVGVLHDVLHGGQAGDRLVVSQLADPLAVLVDGDVAAGVPDERQHGLPVAAREVDAREVGDVGVVGLQRLAGLDELAERRRDLQARLLEQVLAVHDDAGAAVVRHAVELAVVGAGLDQAVDQVVAAQVVLELGQVDHGAGRLVRLGLRVAHLEDVGAVLGRQHGVEPVDEPVPLLPLDLDRDVRVLLRELGLGQLDHLVGRVGPVEPDTQRGLGVGPGRLERPVAGAAGRGVVIVVGATGGQCEHAHQP